MDSVQASRVDGNPQRWGGKNSPQGDKQRRQAHKLQLLYAALKLALPCKAATYRPRNALPVNSSNGVASWRSMQELRCLIAMLIAPDGMLVCTF